MSINHHPKSLVNQFIAQNKTLDIVISEPFYYHTYIKNGNKNIFHCKFDVTYEKITKTIVSKKYLSKKDCEKDAYEQILLLITSKSSDHNINDSASVIDSTSASVTTPVTTFVTTSAPSTCIADILSFCNNDSDKLFIIIDLENIAKINVDIIMSAVNSNRLLSNKSLKILKIAGFCSGIKSSADIVVRSNRKDAVDHYISYLIGIIEGNMLHRTHIYVITRDKFGSCLQDFCNNVIHCSDVEDLLQYISVHT